MTTRFERWSVAFARILKDVEAEMPHASEDERYAEFRKRCEQWKAERGLA